MPSELARSLPPVDEAQLVQAALRRDARAIRQIIEKHNRQLYRIARSILRNDVEAEEAVQDAYINAFAHLDSFRGESALATWLARITMNEAFGRLRRARSAPGLDSLDAPRQEAQVLQFPHHASDPERTLAQREILQLVENAADRLPEIYRIVFVMRVIEGMTVEETAALLDLHPKTVKTRLHRARRLLREEIDNHVGPVLMEAFPFAGRRCERLTESVLQRLSLGA